MAHYLAFDLGAESGRAIAGAPPGRNPAGRRTPPVSQRPAAHGRGALEDIERLWAEIQRGIRVAAERGFRADGIGIDTWGVDYGLLDEQGELIENPRHYRDARNNGMVEAVLARVPREEVFAATGIQFMQINTLYQLYGANREKPEAVARATRSLGKRVPLTSRCSSSFSSIGSAVAS